MNMVAAAFILMFVLLFLGVPIGGDFDRGYAVHQL